MAGEFFPNVRNNERKREGKCDKHEIVEWGGQSIKIFGKPVSEKEAMVEPHAGGIVADENERFSQPERKEGGTRGEENKRGKQDCKVGMVHIPYEECYEANEQQAA